MAGQMADPTVATKAGHWAEQLVDQMAAHSVGQKVARSVGHLAALRVDLLARKMADYSAAKRVVQMVVQWA